MLILHLNLDDTEYIHIFYDCELSICNAIFKLLKKYSIIFQWPNVSCGEYIKNSLMCKYKKKLYSVR